MTGWPYEIGDELGVEHLGTGRWIWGLVIRVVRPLGYTAGGTQLTIRPYDARFGSTYAFYLRGTPIRRAGDDDRPMIVENVVLPPNEPSGYPVIPDGTLVQLRGTSADGLFRKTGVDPKTGAMIMIRVSDDQVAE